MSRTSIQKHKAEHLPKSGTKMLMGRMPGYKERTGKMPKNKMGKDKTNDYNKRKEVITKCPK